MKENKTKLISVLKTKRLLFILFIFFTFFITSSVAEAATLQFSPSSGSHSVGETFTTNVIVDSGGNQANAVEASISFDTSVLSVVNVSENNSSLSLWTTEPTYSNSAGTIEFGGGNPSPFSGQSTLVSVTFRIQSEGSGTVEFTSGGVTGADGTGQDILSNMSSATYTGASAPEPDPEPTPEPEPTPTGDTPDAPLVSSETHPEDNPWHNEYEADFSWNVPSDVTAVRLLVGRQAEATPTVVYDPPIDYRELDDDIFDEDGLWYFHIQFRNSAGWGDITHYEFGFDTEAPKDLEIEIEEGEDTSTPTLYFASEDDLSGIDRYVINVEGMEEIVVSADEHENNDNLYTFTEPLPEGETVIEVTAYDNAGNETVSSLDMIIDETEIPDEAVPDIDEEEDEEGFFSRYGTTIFIVFLFLVIAALLGYIIKLKKEMEEVKKKGKKEIYEVRDEVSRVFSAIRDEAEDLFASFDGKKGLSAKEKEAFKKISDALDVSEEIIGKEIDDVQKLME